jgi:hypothetical protein
MRKILWITVSILAASFAATANAETMDWRVFAEPFVTSAHAADIDWQKVDDALGRKPAVGKRLFRLSLACLLCPQERRSPARRAIR